MGVDPISLAVGAGIGLLTAGGSAIVANRNNKRMAAAQKEAQEKMERLEKSKTPNERKGIDTASQTSEEHAKSGLQKTILTDWKKQRAMASGNSTLGGGSNIA